MSLDAKITKQLDSNYVQVDITSKKEPFKYYKVPKQNADSFVKNYKQQNKQNTYILNGGFALSIFGGVLLAGMLCKNIKNKMTKYLMQTLGGVAASTAVLYGSQDYIDKKEQKLIQKFKAQEIYYQG